MAETMNFIKEGLITSAMHALNGKPTRLRL